MDKKNKYQQPNLKAAVIDAKKSQDANSSKPFPKSSRKREPIGANSYPKNDQPRKSNAQKTKNFDKRPKPKGYHHGNSKDDSKVVEDESAEFGSVMVQGSKKQNLNHLLNFHYAPREGGWSNNRRSGYSSHNNRWLPAVQRHKYNKEQFLQANCQFVVAAKGDYSLYLNDPDILIDWTLVQQIRLHSSENLSCPICLCPPVAGKMTRCGHVYCWPCILHALAISDKSWCKCPICYQSIHKSDLKSVVEITENILNIGDYISLRLMRREKGSLLAVPVQDNESCPPTTFLSVAENSCQRVYSKLLLANNNDILDIIEMERVHLTFELLEDPHSPENYFIEQALKELATRETLLREGISQPEIEASVTISSAEIDENKTLSSPKEEKCLKDVNNDFNLKNNADLNEQFSYKLNIGRNGLEPSISSQKFHYFYQAEGGQNVYLHAMNIKMLEMQYGNLENCPKLISGKLVEKEVGSYTEDLRRRMRYLCHLPLTSVFEIVEIDLQPPIVSEDVIGHFEGQILDRQKKRKRREREERTREKKIIEEQNKLMGKYPTPNVHIESRKHFPQFQPESSEIHTSSSPESVVASSVASSESACSFDDVAFVSENDGPPESAKRGPSFSQMLQGTTSKKIVNWPSLNNFNDNDTTDHATQDHSPPYRRGLTLAEALQQSNLLNYEGRSSGNVTSSKNKKKKKGKANLATST